nr:PREDICTED: uncharacterized protein LOC102361368 [Latimeria chalumnae]|eukprot:XP_006007002.1 PREDICTED: uncharacterized protein LOC102361368 [Latimeria chalumnae]
MMEQGKAEVILGLGQGIFTDSILTDQGKKMTLISDLPYEQRFLQKPKPVSYLGARPMHRTTMKLGNRRDGTDFTTSHEHCYAGKGDGRELSVFPRRLPYPSLHLSDLNVCMSTQEEYPPETGESCCPKEILSYYAGKGDGREMSNVPRRLPYPSVCLSDVDMGMDYRTETAESCCPKEIIPHNIVHRPVLENRTRNIRGTAMKEITMYQGQKPDYQSTYTIVYSLQSRNQAKKPGPTFRTRQHTYNIITGEDRRPAQTASDYRRRSGDWLVRHSGGRSGIYSRLELC